ncbi:hypothetical protein FQA47_019534 [Oryzias melastigma]|uniref:Uncharacterized protein n=1 Tax=Oryzias melastigma TaxID=30732 RepID=A0A834F1T7_ORYME|nr:hypothetical protein FQA47_019534 [Oryzias melastigma]
MDPKKSSNTLGSKHGFIFNRTVSIKPGDCIRNSEEQESRCARDGVCAQQLCSSADVCMTEEPRLVFIFVPQKLESLLEDEPQRKSSRRPLLLKHLQDIQTRGSSTQTLWCSPPFVQTSL